MCATDNANKPGAVLTVAGFDGTGGAGLQIDSKLSTCLQVPNISVVTAVVVQTPVDVQEMKCLSPAFVARQISLLMSYYHIPLVNIGIFGHFGTIRWIIGNMPRSRLIWDPVFSSGSGSFRFVKESDVSKIKKVLDRFYLITPNVPEAEELAGMEIGSVEDMASAARKIRDRWGIENILLKGGHLAGEEGWDLLLHDGGIQSFKTRKSGLRIHGTGSFLNGAIASYLFMGHRLFESVTRAKTLLEEAAANVDPSNPVLVPPIR